jgi:hypothetical protein
MRHVKEADASKRARSSVVVQKFPSFSPRVRQGNF